jgi:hypothetical protein
MGEIQNEAAELNSTTRQDKREHADLQKMS